MEDKEGLNAEIASSKGPAELVATQPGLATTTASVAMEKAETTYFQYCNDDLPLECPGTQVGTNHLIVDNILLYCDYETTLASTRVNHLWRNLAIPSVTLEMFQLDDENTKELLQNVGNLSPFIHLDLQNVNLPRNWMTYSPNLVTLKLRGVDFEQSRDIYEIMFASFPCLETLEIDLVKVRYQSALQDVQIATPKLESLSVRILFEQHNFISSDFCVKVLSKLRNLKTLHIDATSSPHSIPFFAALTKGNIKLEDLKYYLGGAAQPQSLAVMNKYLRVCGESLRSISLAFNSTLPIRPDIFRGYAGKNLNHLDLWENNHRLTLKKDVQGVFQLLLRVDDVQNFPNISEVSLRGTCDDFSQPLPSIESPVLGSSSVDYVGVEFDTSEYQVDEDSRQARSVLFVFFPNVLHLALEASARSLEGVLDFVIEAGRNWPHLRSLSVTTLGNTIWNADNWRNVIAHVVLHLSDLEDVSFLDDGVLFDSTTVIAILLLPKLKRLHVKELKISRTLYERLTNQDVKLESSTFNLED